MCDTMVATPDVTLDGTMLFAKNSDREPNEAHHLLNIPAQDHAKNSRLKVTYIDIPQAEHTHAVLLAKPYWMWGAEMGVNEHGVAIGNEAVFSKVPAQKEPALLGMDLLRLGLERAASARQAVDVITSLLEQYGQGGNCGHGKPLYYHNSYLIADPHQAWLLETIGREWAAKRVQGVYTISNGLTLGNDFDLVSPNLVDYAVQKGWCKDRASFDFVACYSDFLYTRFSDSRFRQQCSLQALSARRGQLSVENLLASLRLHDPGTDGRWRADKGLTGLTVCYHAGFGPVRSDQTTGSMIAHLHPNHPTILVTGSAAPCTSLFKPVWVDIDLPDMGPAPQGKYDPHSLFWQHERLHRATMQDYHERIGTYTLDRDSLEQQFVTQALNLAGEPAAIRQSFSAQVFQEAAQAERHWLERIQALPVKDGSTWYYRRAWGGLNQKAKIPL
jgi:dipeptidase